MYVYVCREGIGKYTIRYNHIGPGEGFGGIEDSKFRTSTNLMGELRLK